MHPIPTRAKALGSKLRVCVHESVARGAENSQVGEFRPPRAGSRTQTHPVVHLQRTVAAVPKPDPVVRAATFTDPLRLVQFPRSILSGSLSAPPFAHRTFSLGNVGHREQFVRESVNEPHRVRPIESLPSTASAGTFQPKSSEPDRYFASSSGVPSHRLMPHDSVVAGMSSRMRRAAS